MVFLGMPLALALGAMSLRLAPDRNFALAALAVGGAEFLAAVLIYGPSIFGAS